MGVQCARVIKYRTIGLDIKNEIVPRSTSGEIFSCVTNDMVKTSRPQHIQFRWTVDAGHFSAIELGNLHGESADSSPRAIDQDLLARPNPTFITQTLYGQHCCLWYRRRFSEGIYPLPAKQMPRIKRNSPPRGETERHARLGF